MLSDKEMVKYSRQMIFSSIGSEGQKKLKQSTVAIVGIGGTGTSAALYLAAAGLNLRLIDRDLVELSNLPRQILYSESDINQPKAIVAKEKLQQMNPDIKIDAFTSDFNPRTAEQLVSDVDVVLDGTDNFETRFVLNDVCVKDNIPFSYVGAIRAQLMFSFFIPRKSACLRCIFPETPPQGALETCEVAGVMGPVTGIAGMINANETLKYLLGLGDLLSNKLLYLDLSDFTMELIEIQKNENCSVCVQHNFDALDELIQGTKAVSLCGQNSYQVIPAQNVELNLPEFGEKLKKNPEFKISIITKILIVMEYSGRPITLFRDGRILIKEINSETEAKTIATKILGF